MTSKDIAVAAKDGVVTLSDAVPTYAEKWAAERTTQRVAGVKSIAEGLEVTPAGTHKRDDPKIAAAVVNALHWHVWVPSNIRFKVEDGWVTLNGTATWGYPMLQYVTINKEIR